MTKVFLSSTSIDLRAEREAATLAIRNFDQHDCIGMESFGARNSSPVGSPVGATHDQGRRGRRGLGYCGLAVSE